MATVARRLGQQVRVENSTDNDVCHGAHASAEAPADATVFYFIGTSGLIGTSGNFAPPTCRPQRELQPAALAARNAFELLVEEDSPLRTLQGLMLHLAAAGRGGADKPVLSCEGPRTLGGIFCAASVHAAEGRGQMRASSLNRVRAGTNAGRAGRCACGQF